MLLSDPIQFVATYGTPGIDQGFYHAFATLSLVDHGNTISYLSSAAEYDELILPGTTRPHAYLSRFNRALPAGSRVVCQVDGAVIPSVYTDGAASVGNFQNRFLSIGSAQNGLSRLRGGIGRVFGVRGRSTPDQAAAAFAYLMSAYRISPP